MMKWLIISCFLISGFLNACPTELQKKLLKHLATEQLWTERFEMISSNREQKCMRWDMELAWTLIQVKKYTEADSVLQLYPTKTIDSCGWKNMRIWNLFKQRNILQLKNETELNIEFNYCQMLLTQKNVILRDSNTFDRINDAFSEYNNIMRKSTFLAGLISIVPGMGKLYCGYNKQVVTNIILQGALGLIITEIVLRKGTDSGVFFAATALAATFWLGSIYGTVVSLKKEKKDRLDALYIEITDRFLTTYIQYPY
jgi:hypothetical protein